MSFNIFRTNVRGMTKENKIYLRMHANKIQKLASSSTLSLEEAKKLCRQIGPYSLLSKLSGIFFNYAICYSLLAESPQKWTEIIARIIYAALQHGIPPADKKSMIALQSWRDWIKEYWLPRWSSATPSQSNSS